MVPPVIVPLSLCRGPSPVRRENRLGEISSERVCRLITRLAKEKAQRGRVLRQR